MFQRGISRINNAAWRRLRDLFHEGAARTKRKLLIRDIPRWNMV